MSDPTCPQCNVTMEIGHLVDQAHSRLLTAKWVNGPAEWAGVEWLRGRKFEDHDVYRVVAHRCPECGPLQIFARTPATSKERRGRA